MYFILTKLVQEVAVLSSYALVMKQTIMNNSDLEN